MMWLMDHVFQYTNFGLVSLIHGDFFIRQVRTDTRGLQFAQPLFSHHEFNNNTLNTTHIYMQAVAQQVFSGK